MLHKQPDSSCSLPHGSNKNKGKLKKIFQFTRAIRIFKMLITHAITLRYVFVTTYKRFIGLASPRSVLIDITFKPKKKLFYRLSLGTFGSCLLSYTLESCAINLLQLIWLTTLLINERSYRMVTQDARNSRLHVCLFKSSK